ncbi:hypothetical protein ACS0PU_000082 [Formica fusca]
MEKVSLYDSERDVIVDVRLSPEDLLRAHTDTVFATSLLNAAMKERHITINENSIESIPTEQTIPKIYKSAHTKTNAEMNTESDTDDSLMLIKFYL